MTVSCLIFAGLGVPILLTSVEANRVDQARKNTLPALKKLAQTRNLSYPLSEIYIRAFKKEKELEVWATNKPGTPMILLATYTVVAASGSLGPKRREGDRQVPEGFYWIDRFNPNSSYHLSLGINYPNASDRKRSDPKKPGGDIFIHGSQVSIGCLAMTDPIIEQIYLIADDARKAGQRKIPVHIFPFRMTQKSLDTQSKLHDLSSFWSELKPGYDSFEKAKRPPAFTVLESGAYKVSTP